MTWIILILLIALGFLLVRAFVRGAGEAIDRFEFEHWIHSFLKLKKDGSSLALQHSKSKTFLRLQRVRGHSRRCNLLVDVPRARWSEQRAESLRTVLLQKGVTALEPTDTPSTLLRITLEVDDIWDESSGAGGARLAREIFEVLGLEREARFNVTMTGENSNRTWEAAAERWQEEGNPIVRGIGRSIAAEVEREAAEERDRDANQKSS
jgi:hypothetical protein